MNPSMHGFLADAGRDSSDRGATSTVKRVVLAIVVVVVLVLLSGAAYLATWEIPPPESISEKVLSDDRFPR